MNEFMPTKKYDNIPQPQTTTLMVEGVPSEVAFDLLVASDFSLTPAELRERVEGKTSVNDTIIRVNFDLFSQYFDLYFHENKEISVEEKSGRKI